MSLASCDRFTQESLKDVTVPLYQLNDAIA